MGRLFFYEISESAHPQLAEELAAILPADAFWHLGQGGGCHGGDPSGTRPSARVWMEATATLSQAEARR